MNQKPVIHIVDDDDSLRTALLRLVRAHGFDAVGYASAGEFLLHPPADSHGCVLLDVYMPGPSGIELHAALKPLGSRMPVIFMTGRGDVASCLSAMKGGAVDYLEKPIEPDTLLAALDLALRRDERARGLRRERDELQSSFATLSDRERRVFDLIVSGRLNKQIADDLGVAERTVKAQRANLMTKLGAGSAAALGRFAERLRAIGEESA